MRILVLGSSNAIRRGYVTALQQAFPEAEIVNRSIGASPGTQYALYCAEDLTVFDAVVFESAINDQNYRTALGEDSFTERLLFEIFSTISAQTRLVVLGLCSHANLHAEPSMLALHRALAQRAGARFVDGQAIVARCTFSPTGVLGHYDDDDHPTVPLALIIGHEVANVIAALPLERRAQSFRENFRVLKPWETEAGIHVYEKSNSYITSKFLELNHGQTIGLAGDFRVIGFYLDTTNSYGFVRLLSDEATRDIRVYCDTGMQSLLIRFIPVRDGMRANMIACSPTSLNFEVPPHSSAPPLEPVSARMSISQIALWNHE